MDYKYDAFISYRHAEKDSMIASEIQKSLERFNIPGPLRKKTGKKRFNRVFRDVEELPISSNLTEDIEEALKASQFLIVICSYRTSESDWVKREIDTFLELHDYNKQLVLTVLVEGEPDEVVPEVLRHDNITHYLADGTFYCKDEVVEPLSADYRMPIPKARKIELPRLAAAMLDCNYDDIIRRRKAYKRTRLLIETAVISIAAIVLVVNVVLMLKKINDNFKNSQINQARYLSSESQKLLEEGDRIGAIQLALAAFEDSDGSRRPVTSEALYALSSAMGSYSIKGSTFSEPVWRYETTSSVVRYGCYKDSNRVAILDASGKLYVWDSKTHTRLAKPLENEQDRLRDFRFDKNGNLIVVNGYSVSLYNSSNLKEMWTSSFQTYNKNKDNLIEFYSGKGYILLNSSTSMTILNAEDGKVIKTIETKDDPAFSGDSKSKKKSTNLSVSIDKFVVNSDFSKIAVAAKADQFENIYGLYVYDLATGKWSSVIQESGPFQKIDFDKQGNIFALRYSKENANADTMASTDLIYDSSIILEMISSDGNSAWKTELPSMTRVLSTNLISSTYNTKDGKSIPVILAAFANRMVAVDRNNGEVVKTFDLPESIVLSYTTESSVVTLISNGMAFWLPLTEGTKSIQSRKYFKDGVMKMVSYTDEDGNFSYLVEDASKRVITEYSAGFADTSYKGFEGAESSAVVKDSIKCGKYLVTIWDNGKISGFDLDTHKAIWTLDSLEEKYFYFDTVTFEDRYVYFIKENKDKDGNTNYTIAKLRSSDGQFEEVNSEFSVTKNTSVRVSNGIIWGRNIEEKSLTIFAYKMSDDSVKKTVVDISDLGSVTFDGNMTFSPDGKQALFYVMEMFGDKLNYTRVTIDCETGKYKTTECGSCNKTVWNETGTRFAESYDEGMIRIFSTATNEMITEINTELRMTRGMTFNGNTLYVIYNTDVLCRYDGQGNQVMNINLGHGDMSEQAFTKFEVMNGYLFLTAGGYTDIINLNDSKSVAYFTGYQCFYSTKPNDVTLNDTIVVCKAPTTKYGSSLGYFEYKTPSKLIKQAKDFLEASGAKTSDELKRRYGLE